MSIWAPAQRRRVVARPRGVRLSGRVKDWPDEAKLAFKDVKNQLWKWAKKHNVPNKKGLALLAYQGVKEAFEGTPEKTVIHTKTEEDTWQTLLKISSETR